MKISNDIRIVDEKDLERFFKLITKDFEYLMDFFHKNSGDLPLDLAQKIFVGISYTSELTTDENLDNYDFDKTENKED
jgi:hypothetical protein